MFTTVETSVLSLLILYHVQDFFMNMFKEDLDQDEFPDQDNISHYIITGVKIITDSILYSTVIDVGEPELLGGLNLKVPWKSAFCPDFRYHGGELEIQFSIKVFTLFLLWYNKNFLQGVIG